MGLRIRRTGRALRIGVLTALLVGTGAAAAPAPAPAGLPARLGIGVAAPPDADGLEGWIPQSGVPWDYAYQYLAGGVGTGGGWQHWGDATRFPGTYARRAAARGTIPVFTYYMLQQSRGRCAGCGEAQQDLAHLNDPALMRAYWDDVALLLRRLGPGSADGVAGFGRTAVVHVEPDLAGFAQHAVLDPARCHGFCTGQGNDPSLLRASVAGSGHPDLAGLPDTFAGYVEAFRRLRDRYAPNVLLGFHASPWASLRDVAVDPDPSLDAVSHGRLVGEFANRAGAGRYDLVFTDVADRDASQRPEEAGRAHPWWDADDVVQPTFARWERWLRSLTATVAKPAVVWQIPVGNQVYATMDGSVGHYQDNRVELMFSRVERLRDAGVVALLFGPGHVTSTHHWDARRDGVTNPPPRCTRAGHPQREVCNTRRSTVADDDGGLLRELAGAYYRAPLGLPSGSGVVPPAVAQASVERLYRGAFLRAGDPAGVAHWTALVAGGTPLRVVADAFATSAEFQGRYGAPDDAGYIELVYRNVLGRSPDSAGRTYWLAELGAKRLTRGNLLAAFTESNEFRSRTGIA